jgi:ssDNA-binding Zn-finger/Zn-ribbon topoisomerase 1
MSGNELKALPCPFCGSEATIYELKCGWYVDCGNDDDCSFTPRLQEGIHRKEDAVAKWNTRDTSAIEAAVLRKWAAQFGREAYPDYEDKFGEGHYLALTNASRMLHEEANKIEQEAKQ